jgi:hypothetical protein
MHPTWNGTAPNNLNIGSVVVETLSDFFNAAAQKGCQDGNRNRACRIAGQRNTLSELPYLAP